MKSVKHVSTFLLFLCNIYVLAQTPDDAIRYSENTFGTTARSMSMAGAFGALGSDFSSLSQNPGGLGVYRRSEFTISPTFNFNNVSNEYLGNKESDGRFFFNMANAGFVGSNYDEEKQGWKGWNWGVGFNRENCWRYDTKFSGINTNNSLLNSYVEDVDGVPIGSLEDIEYAFGPGMAYNLYLINPSSQVTNSYTSAIPHGGELQQDVSDIKGNIGNWLFSLANNYKDKLFVGLTMEFKSLRYDYKNTYKESDVNDSIISPYFGMNFSSFTLYRNEYTKGSAIDFKFGMIYKLNEMVRLGAAIHSPAWYSMHYKDDYNMESTFGSLADSLFTLNEPPSSEFDYKLNTPFRALGSIALIFPGTGLISADYEFVNHQTAKFKSQDDFGYNFSEENEAIKKYHAGQHIIRIGGELLSGDFAYRLGVAYYSSPYASDVIPNEYDYSSISGSAGIGYRKKSFFIDAGYALSTSKKYYEPYSLNDGSEPAIYSNVASHRIMFTVGFKF